MSPRAPRPLRPGAPLGGDYRVVAHLRRGDECDVYDAESLERRCRCVVKALRPDRAQSRRARLNLRRESELLLGTTHPGIVRAYGLVMATPPMLVLETLPGITLGGMLEDGARLATGDLIQLGAQLASTLAYLHDRGVVHRDVKPGNIVCSGGQARLLDFGIACAPGLKRDRAGTDGWMAPEQLATGHVSPASDCWALGMVLYAAATGVAPKKVNRRVPVIDLRRLPRDLGSTIEALLADQPEDRPALDGVLTTLLTLP